MAKQLTITAITPHATYVQTVTEQMAALEGVTFEQLIDQVGELVAMASSAEIGTYTATFPYTQKANSGTALREMRGQLCLTAQAVRRCDFTFEITEV